MAKTKLNWHSSNKIESLCIIGIVRESSLAFLTKHNFLFLPYIYRDVIFLPRIDYSFITKLTSLKITNVPKKEYYLYPLNQKEKEVMFSIQQQLSTLPIPKPYQKREKIITSCQEDWSKINKIIGEILPQWEKVSSIDVYLVKYGTVSSFDYLSQRGKDKIIIWLRQTLPNLEVIKSHFVHALVSALVLQQTKIPDRSDLWTAREFAIDFLLSHTRLAEVVKPVETISELRRNNLSKKVIEDDQAFKKEILRYYQPPPLTLVADQQAIQINKTTITLSPLEWRLIQTLAKNRGKFISTSKLAETIYPDNDNFFGWSLAKVVERVRKKIALAGVTQPVIVSARGMGYMLAK